LVAQKCAAATRSVRESRVVVSTGQLMSSCSLW
jgi:hypothetical protein